MKAHLFEQPLTQVGDVALAICEDVVRRVGLILYLGVWHFGNLMLALNEADEDYFTLDLRVDLD